MDSTKVKTSQVLETLKANRQKHEKDYKEAMEIWEKKVKDRLTKVRREAGKGNFDHVQTPLADLPRPEKFLDEYDDAITQMEWEVEETIALAEHEFRQYVLDQWTWRKRFIANTSAYLVT